MHGAWLLSGSSEAHRNSKARVWCPTDKTLSRELIDVKTQRLVTALARECEEVLRRVEVEHSKALRKRKWRKASMRGVLKRMSILGGGGVTVTGRDFYEVVALSSTGEIGGEKELSLSIMCFDSDGISEKTVFTFTYHAMARLVERWGGEIDGQLVNILAASMFHALINDADDRDEINIYWWRKKTIDLYIEGVGLFIIASGYVVTFVGDEMLSSRQKKEVVSISPELSEREDTE
ncbi:hypothetical protein [uncultured Umboniibacter sp.]|uniref:hypothetical protein n=1 Tax=uncultured Umboniibacter sp. TaxID=1798917 RepID=UPI0026139EFB|nr:hypothetical protein [uncultured Umboniibacter sp.]